MSIKAYLNQVNPTIGKNDYWDIKWIWRNWATAISGKADETWLTHGWYDLRNSDKEAIKLTLFNVSFDDKTSGQRVNNINLTVDASQQYGLFAYKSGDGTELYYATVVGSNGIRYNVALASKQGDFAGWTIPGHEIGKLCISRGTSDITLASTVEFSNSSCTSFEQDSAEHATPIKAMDGKDIHAIAEPICNGIDWGVNHGFDLFADILTRPLIKVYGEEPASWSWAKQPANGTKYVDILRSMEWHVEGRNFITTDYVHQGGAGSQERFVMLEEKGVGGTYGLYSANPGAPDRGYPRDNEIYFIQGSPHGGGSVIKKINSGGGCFPEFNVSGGGSDWEFVPVTSISSAIVSPYGDINDSNNYKIRMTMTITFQDGTQTKIDNAWSLQSGINTDHVHDFGNLNDVLYSGVKLQRQSDSPTSYPGIRFRLGFQSGNNNDWRWSMRRLSIIADGESASSALIMDDPYTYWVTRGYDFEVFRYKVDRWTQVENWFKQFGYWKKKSF